METTVSIWPAIIWIALAACAMTVNLFKHGESKGKYNFWLHILIDLPLSVWLMWAGNFFAPLGWGV